MSESYYDTEDLKDYKNLGEYASEPMKRFNEYHDSVADKGVLDKKTKALIGLAVSITQKCPYCIDIYTGRAMKLGATNEEIMEAVHMGAVVMSGQVMTHALQVRKKFKKVSK